MTGPTEQDQDLLTELHHLIESLEANPDPAVGEQVRALLAGVDTIHRTALTHLLDAIHGLAGEAFVNRLTSDPAIRLLFMSYDLLAVDRRLLAEEAMDPVRGHLHAHGVDVELLEVVGGVVYVRLHGLEQASGVNAEAVRHDLEAALHAGLTGFQELVVRGREPVEAAAFVQLGGSRRAHRPVYSPACLLAEVGAGTTKAVQLAGQSVLVANVAGELYAVQNRCGDGPLPLEFSALEGAELHCSWHGCRYDVRTGKRLDGGDERLMVYPVAVEAGEVKVALGVEPAGAG